MSRDIAFPQKQEHSVTVENVNVRMLTTPIYNERAGGLSLLHTHTHAELFACSEGSFQIKTARGTLSVGAGDIVIVPPELQHCRLPSPKSTVFHCLDFVCLRRKRRDSADLMGRLETLFKPDCFLVVRGVPRLCAQVEKATESCLEMPQLSALLLAGVLCELCEREVEYTERGELPSPTAPLEKRRDIDRLSRLDYLIHTGFSNPELSVRMAAKLLYISQRHLERITHLEYGMSFHRRLCQQRVTAGAQMLCESELSVEEIACACGFANRNAFSRAFAARWGESPSAYRAKNRRKGDPYLG